MQISITEEEKTWLMSELSSTMIRFGDEGDEGSDGYKIADKLHTKLVKAFNRTGHYYLWQLIDREGEVTTENIKEEWRK